MTEKALKFLQTKFEKDKEIQRLCICVSSHSMKIGCREVGGSWLSIKIQDIKDIEEGFEQIGAYQRFPILFDKDSLYFLHEFSNLTFDLDSENSSKIIFRELEK